MPFGCEPEDIERHLSKFVNTLVSQQAMASVSKIYFIPVGLPGMGKSTLAKHIKQTVVKFLGSGKDLHAASLPQVSFAKISYDRILGENVTEYSAVHPETPFHEVIDIIRAKADSDYLEKVR